MLHIWVTGEREKTAVKEAKDADNESVHSGTVTIQLDCEDGRYDRQAKDADGESGHSTAAMIQLNCDDNAYDSYV